MNERRDTYGLKVIAWRSSWLFQSVQHATLDLRVMSSSSTLGIKVYLKKIATSWRKIYHANTNQKKNGTVILLSYSADLKARKVIKDRGPLRSDKSVNSPRSNNLQCVYA